MWCAIANAGPSGLRPGGCQTGGHGSGGGGTASDICRGHGTGRGGAGFIRTTNNNATTTTCGGNWELEYRTSSSSSSYNRQTMSSDIVTRPIAAWTHKKLLELDTDWVGSRIGSGVLLFAFPLYCIPFLSAFPLYCIPFLSARSDRRSLGDCYFGDFRSFVCFLQVLFVQRRVFIYFLTTSHDRLIARRTPCAVLPLCFFVLFLPPRIRSGGSPEHTHGWRLAFCILVTSCNFVIIWAREFLTGIKLRASVRAVPGEIDTSATATYAAHRGAQPQTLDPAARSAAPRPRRGSARAQHT